MPRAAQSARTVSSRTPPWRPAPGGVARPSSSAAHRAALDPRRSQARPGTLGNLFALAGGDRIAGGEHHVPMHAGGVEPRITKHPQADAPPGQVGAEQDEPAQVASKPFEPPDDRRRAAPQAFQPRFQPGPGVRAWRAGPRGCAGPASVRSPGHPAGASIALPLASLVQMEPISMRVAAMMRAAAGVCKILVDMPVQSPLRLYQKTRFGSIGQAGQPPAGTPTVTLTHLSG
jgi:hypothetical protein